jgi:putative membrane protein
MGSEDRRLHPASFLFGLAAHLRQLVIPGLFLLFTAQASEASWQIWAMALFVPYAIATIGRTLSYRYRFDPSELVIRTGFFFRNERHVPYARIQNVDAVRTIWHRALGVADVRVETGSGSEPEATLSVVSLDAFDEIRGRVFEGHGGADEMLARPRDAEAPSQGRVLLHLSGRELAICGLIQGRGAIVIGALFGIMWESGLVDRLMGMMFGAQTTGRGVTRQLVRAIIGLGQAPVARLALTIAAFALVLLLIRLLSIAWALVKLHDFTLTRDGEKLRSEYGLLTRVTATIPIHRIQTLTIQEGPFHRLFRRVTVRVETAGGDGDETLSERQVLAPVIRREAVPGLLAETLPDLPRDVVWQGVHPRGVRRAFVESAIGGLVLAAMLIVLLEWWTLVLLAMLLAWAALNARLTIKWLGWAVDTHVVMFRSGWSWRRTTIATYGKLQVIKLTESPFDRRHHMARVSADTAGAALGAHRVDIPYLPRDTAVELAGILAARAARTTFRW